MGQCRYMAGYGVKIENLLPLLNEETAKKYEETDSIFSTFDKDILEDSIISGFTGSEIECLYARDRSCYDPCFKNKDEADTYFYDNLKAYLKEDVTKEQLAEQLDDLFDWDYC